MNIKSTSSSEKRHENKILMDNTKEGIFIFESNKDLEYYINNKISITIPAEVRYVIRIFQPLSFSLLNAIANSIVFICKLM